MNTQRQTMTGTYAIKITVEEEGVILGWAILIIVQNERHSEPYGFMENLYVEQEHRGKGVGRHLMETLIAEAKRLHCYKIIGTSKYEKKPAHALYEKLGFEDWGKEFRMDLRESKSLQRD